ncbi:MAG TPA: T9SS type A sorting domain-containing protein [Ignavibacteria bacterium]|nr:T9SS type A sorting domain-containing protein [Ignavibacteria bacterium]
MRKLTYPLIAAILMIMVSMVPFGTSTAQDSLPIGGKGMFLWHLWTANGGGKNLNTVITKLKSVGVTWLVIKMGDGDSYYNSPNHSLYNWATSNYGSMDSVVAVFHANGIKLLAFQYVYGVPHHWGNPASETDVANSILDVKGIDGLLIDAEIQYDILTTRVAAARAYCDSIHAHHPDAFIGLISWDSITGHRTFPWTTFLDRVDVNMPMMYWAAKSTTPQNILSFMSGQFTYYTKIWVNQGDSAAAKPIMPLGQGEYFGYGNDVRQGDITSFCDLSQTKYNYPGVSLWEYSQISHSYVWNEYAAAWQVTFVSAESNAPIRYNLSQNYPDPFNPTTTINYTVPKNSFVIIRVYDILGNEVTTLVNEEKSVGNYNVQFNGSNLASGIYFYSMHAGNYVETKKLILMK